MLKIKPKVILTGSEGYIGKNFKLLYGKFYNIISIDKKINFPIYDLDDSMFWDNNIYSIIHLAAISGISNCNNNPYTSINDNILSTFHLLQLAKKFRIPTIFFSSQAAKNPGGSIYAMTKKCGEVFASEDNINIKVIRPSNVYGGKYYLQMKDSVISRFANAYLNDDPIIIHGFGAQYRDFIHVNEVCRCIRHLLVQNQKINTPLDLGTGHGRTIASVAQQFDNDSIVYKTEIDPGPLGNVSDESSRTILRDRFEFEAVDFLDEYIKSIKKGDFYACD